MPCPAPSPAAWRSNGRASVRNRRYYISAMDSDVTTTPPLKGVERIAAYLKTLPDQPGVYRMLGEKGDVLYVGKAKSLKKRVTSYAKGGGHNERISRMISETSEM